MFSEMIIYLRRKKIIKCLTIVFYLFCIIVCITSCSNRNSNNGERTEIINIGEEIYAGNQYYDKDDYKNAISYYAKAYKAGKEDGIILYRIAYSAEQLQGLTNEVKEVY
jgi:hypothetical protein